MSIKLLMMITYNTEISISVCKKKLVENTPLPISNGTSLPVGTYARVTGDLRPSPFLQRHLYLHCTVQQKIGNLSQPMQRYWPKYRFFLAYGIDSEVTSKNEILSSVIL